jgi:hypothetical protein
MSALIAGNECPWTKGTNRNKTRQMYRTKGARL